MNNCFYQSSSIGREIMELAIIHVRVNKNLEFLIIFIYLLEEIRHWAQTGMGLSLGEFVYLF